MMSIYSWVCQIYTPHDSVHLRYNCIFVQQPSLLDDVLGGRELVSLKMNLETERLSDVRDVLGGCD